MGSALILDDSCLWDYPLSMYSWGTVPQGSIFDCHRPSGVTKVRPVAMAETHELATRHGLDRGWVTLPTLHHRGLGPLRVCQRNGDADTKTPMR